MTILTKDQILNSDDVPFELVKVPEWGGDVRVRGMTGTERDSFESAVQDRRKGTGPNAKIDIRNLRSLMVALSVVDEEGNRLFTEADVAALNTKSGAALTTVVEVVQRINGLTDKDVEEIAKNS